MSQESKRYQSTVHACFVGYMVQAVVNNFAPLLFLTFQSQYGIPLSQITLLVTVNFCIQLLVDLVSARFVDRIGYRASLLAAHLTAAVGLAGLAVLPEWLPNAFSGLLLSVAVYAVGGGLLEVLLSPVVEACPTEHKEKTMSLLHAFYCWGQVTVVLLSTLFFTIFGIEHWKWVACFWALLPLFNGLRFLRVPLAKLVPAGEESLPLRELFSQKVFWLFLLMMACAGASELTVSQWASTFAEQGLGVSKTVGDLAGPMLFAVLMGGARTFYGTLGNPARLDRFMLGSSILCVISYLCIALVPVPAVGLAACGLCGLSVGILWPGTFSKASAAMRRGGTAMFAFLALAGDLGCAGGPTLAGLVSGAWGNDLRKGILAAVAFPLLLAISLCVSRHMAGKKRAAEKPGGN